MKYCNLMFIAYECYNVNSLFVSYNGLFYWKPIVLFISSNSVFTIFNYQQYLILTNLDYI